VIRFLLFGSLELRVTPDTDARSVLAQSKHTALLAYLVLGNNGLHRRERLAALLWPELDDARGRNALSKAIHNLRRTFGDDVLLLRGNDAVGINAAALWCDATEFERALAEGKRAEALALYGRGELLEGFRIDDSADFEQWLDSARLRYRQAAMKAAAVLGDDTERAGDLPTAVRWTRLESNIASHDENVLRKLMQRLVASGDRAGALAAYREFAKRLQRDLEVEPGPETRTLAELLRAAGASGNSAANGAKTNGAKSNGIKANGDESTAPSTNGARQNGGNVNGAAAHVPTPATDYEESASQPDESDTVTSVVGGAGVAADVHVVSLGSRSRSRHMAMASFAAVASTTLVAVSGSWFPAHVRIDSTVVAVSPLLVEAGDSSLKSVAAIATEGIVQQLSQSNAGVVDLRNSNATRDSGAVGSELRANARDAGAGKLVGGRMYAKGDSLFANVQISDAYSGRVLHQSDTYASPASSPLLIQARLRDGVAGAVAALTDTLYLPWSKAHSRPPNFAAFQAFMLGLDALVQQGPEQAVAHLKRSIALDTTFVEAKIWLMEQADMLPEERGLVDSLQRAALAQRGNLGEFDRLSLDREIAFLNARWEEAYAISRQLVRIAPDTPDGYIHLANAAMATRRYAEAVRTVHSMRGSKGWLEHLGMITGIDLISHRLDGDLEGALAEWKKAREARPNAAPLCINGLVILASLGREAAVASTVSECMGLPGAPRNAPYVPWAKAAQGFRSQGNVVAAKRYFERALAAVAVSKMPEAQKQWQSGLMYCELGEWARAFEHLRASMDSTDVSARATVAVAAAHVGDTAFVSETLGWMDAQHRKMRTRDRDMSDRAFVVLAQGKRDEAIALLQQAIKEGRNPSQNTWYVRFELDPLRNDPRFQEMIRPIR